MRRTKIIATLGPVTSSPAALERLILLGVNIFRFNMSHAPHDWVRTVAKSIREISARHGLEVGLLLDTQGPAIRTGVVAKTYDLQIDDWVSFTVKGQPGTVQITVDANYPYLVEDIAVGSTVIVDNGNLRLQAIEKRENELVCKVLTPGPLGSRRHINLPGVDVKLPALTEKDYADVELAFECDMDFIAMSFVRRAADIDLLREKIKEKKSAIRIVAKIEDQMAVRNIEEIIAACDGLMIARGDLGIEVPYEELPIIQRRAINLCLAAIKPVIVATHLLESMITNPSPTRAEITDIANAVFEHSDAIMLSGETTTGKYPFECVEIMDRIAARIETGKTVGTYVNPIQPKTTRERINAATAYLANESKSVGICVYTHTGTKARFIAGLRPQTAPIYAFTPSMTVCRSLSLHFGIRAHLIVPSEDPNETLLQMISILREKGYATKGDSIVVVSDLVAGRETLHAIHVHEIK
ncbi:MAG: pyruvate kinase [Methylacidiphilales bacterium]|nr:pyruvate kinase [Candidatus Methylacidiphilales bacterium]